MDAQTPTPRIVPPSPNEPLRRRGLRVRWYYDLYHHSLTLRWWTFLGVGCATYLAVNVLFACLYLVQPGSILGAERGFWNSFFFSVQTIATIGYGQMSPGTFYCNVLVTIETMTGLVFLALATGITFARISRPSARVMFAHYATVGPQDGMSTLSFRLGNERVSQILEADVTVMMLRNQRTLEGIEMRRFYDLGLQRSHTPVFSLTFTIMHNIDERSPLYGMQSDDLIGGDIEFLVSVTGLEEITSQTVHARHRYKPEEIHFDHRFSDIFTSDAKGKLIDYTRFHETEPLPLRPAEGGQVN